jgi:hypothetical protein
MRVSNARVYELIAKDFVATPQVVATAVAADAAGAASAADM